MGGARLTVSFAPSKIFSAEPRKPVENIASVRETATPIYTKKNSTKSHETHFMVVDTGGVSVLGPAATLVFPCCTCCAGAALCSAPKSAAVVCLWACMWIGRVFKSVCIKDISQSRPEPPPSRTASQAPLSVATSAVAHATKKASKATRAMSKQEEV